MSTPVGTGVGEGVCVCVAVGVALGVEVGLGVNVCVGVGVSVAKRLEISDVPQAKAGNARVKSNAVNAINFLLCFIESSLI